MNLFIKYCNNKVRRGNVLENPVNKVCFVFQEASEGRMSINIWNYACLDGFYQVVRFSSMFS